MDIFTELTIPTFSVAGKKKLERKVKCLGVFNFAVSTGNGFSNYQWTFEMYRILAWDSLKNMEFLPNGKPICGIGFCFYHMAVLDLFGRCSTRSWWSLPWGQQALQATWLCKWWDAPGGMIQKTWKCPAVCIDGWWNFLRGFMEFLRVFLGIYEIYLGIHGMKLGFHI